MTNDLFYAKAIRGFYIKSTLDTLSQKLSNVELHFTKKGMFLRTTDAGKNIMFNVSYERENWTEYRCKEEFVACIDIKFLSKLLRNVKKKDTLVIRVIEDEPRILRFESCKTDSKTGPRVEINRIDMGNQINGNGEPITLLPEDALPDGNYGYGMSIDSSEFQKIRKFASLGVKVIQVSIQSNNYLSFKGGADKVFNTEIEFGEKRDDPEDEEDSSESEEGEREETSDLKSFYIKDFHLVVFTMIVKMAGLGPQIIFYRPRKDRYPLKIVVKSVLGLFEVYIKDKDQIQLEQKYQQEKI